MIFQGGVERTPEAFRLSFESSIGNKLVLSFKVDLIIIHIFLTPSDEFSTHASE